MDKLPKDYKIVPYNKNRFIVVDTLTGEIINDTNGYGFKSKHAAYKSMFYKLNESEINKKKQTIRKWEKEHKDFCNSFEDQLYYFAEDNLDFTTKKFKELLKEYNIDIETLPYKPAIMMKYLMNY